MPTDTWIVILTVIGTLIALLTLFKTVRDSAKKTAQELADKEARIATDSYNRGKADGVALCQPQIALVTSQRDDAWHDRDVFQAQANEAWGRYNDLRDRRSH